MLFNRITLILLCFISVQQGFSQEEDNINQSVYVRYNIVSDYKLADWSAFVEGYNTGVNPIDKLGDFKPLASYDIGYRFTFNKIYTSLSYQHYHGRATATFDYNEKRQFDLYANAVSWGFGVKLGKSDKKLSFSPFINIRFGDKIRIVSDYIYADGFHSWGNERGLNGTYMGQGLLGEELGLLIKYRMNSKFSIELELSKMWANSVTPSTIDDKSLYKAFKGEGFGSSLPQDYLTYYNDPAQYTLDNGKYVSDKISATTIKIGLSYTFLNKKNSTWWH